MKMNGMNKDSANQQEGASRENRISMKSHAQRRDVSALLA
jgi:hypothetical protein